MCSSAILPTTFKPQEHHMRTTSSISILAMAATALTFLSGCTVKDVDAPALAGPSTFAHSIVMVADRDSLTQNGSDFTDIRITATGPAGQSESISLRAQVYVDGVAQDYGTLSTKNPITPTTIRYTAPAASVLAAGQVAQTISIRVTPASGGDFRGEIPREIDLRLVPQGIILPTNPNLVAAFTIAPVAPKVLDPVTFDASVTTNGGSACASACTYAWAFGDGTASAGQVTTHQYRATGTYQATLTVTDARGAQAVKTTAVVVAPGAPPTTVDFTFSPTPALVEQTIFFNASASRAASGRTIVKYDWDFGKGTTGTGVTVSKSYDVAGTYTVTLTVTDDAGTIGTTSKPVTVSNPVILPSFTILPAAPAVGEQVSVNASGTTGPSPIVSYSWNFGTGSTPSTATGITAVTTYGSSGNKVITLTVTDSAGRTATTTRSVTVP
jgi:PKD repeat protein